MMILCIFFSLSFFRQFLHVRNRLRPRLPSHAERRLPGPETGESPPRPRRTFENHRFWFRKETHRQVKETPSKIKKNFYTTNSFRRRRQQTNVFCWACVCLSVCVCVPCGIFIFFSHNSLRENVIQIRKCPRGCVCPEQNDNTVVVVGSLLGRSVRLKSVIIMLWKEVGGRRCGRAPTNSHDRQRKKK